MSNDQLQIDDYRVMKGVILGIAGGWHTAGAPAESDDPGAPAFPIPKIVVVGRYTAHWSAGRATGSGEAGALLRFIPKGGTRGGGVMFNSGLENRTVGSGGSLTVRVSAPRERSSAAERPVALRGRPVGALE